MSKSSLISWIELTKWILSGALGWMLGASFLMGVTEAIPSATMDTLGAIAFVFLMFGVIIGVTQWLALKSILPPPASWIAITGLGFLVASFVWIAYLTSDQVNLLLRSILLGLAFGLPIGLLQSLSWIQHHGRVRWWTIASVLGFVGGFMIVALFSELSLQPPTVIRIDLPSTVVPPAMASLATGLVLKKHLLSQASAGRNLQGSAS